MVDVARALAVVLLGMLGTAHAECKIADFNVRITKVQWVDECRTRSCPFLKGAAVLTSNCAEPAGVQVRIVGLNSRKEPIAVRELWPFSTRNVAQGSHPFSLDTWLEHDPDVKAFSLEVVSVRRW